MTISVYAPATVANLSVGFDLLGAALAPLDDSCLGDRLKITRSSQSISVTCSGDWQHKLPVDPHQNIVYQCAEHFLTRLPQEQSSGLSIELEKNLPVGSGLGSSASSVVAAFFALNELFARPFNQDQLLEMMGEFEGRVSGSVHYDNVAPCYLGGLQLLVQSDKCFCASIPFFEDWYWIVAYPGISLSTEKMRALLPAEYSRADLIKYGRLLSGFIHAAHSQNAELAASMLQDVVAEPYRRKHIPGYDVAKKSLKHIGVLASGISGSGPTMFAVTNCLKKAEEAADWLKSNYANASGSFTKICRISKIGVHRT